MNTTQLATELTQVMIEHRDCVRQVSTSASTAQATWSLGCTCGWLQGIYQGPAALDMLQHHGLQQRRHMATVMAEIAERHARVDTTVPQHLAVDLNVRVRGDQTFTGFEHAPTLPEAGQSVRAHEVETDICAPAIVTEVDWQRRLIFLDVAWRHFGDCRCRR